MSSLIFHILKSKFRFRPLAGLSRATRMAFEGELVTREVCFSLSLSGNPEKKNMFVWVWLQRRRRWSVKVGQFEFWVKTVGSSSGLSCIAKNII